MSKTKNENYNIKCLKLRMATINIKCLELKMATIILNV